MYSITSSAAARLAATVRAQAARTRLTRELRHNSPLLGARFDPTGRFVFAGAQDNSVIRWDLWTGGRAVLSGHRSWIRAIAFQGGRAFSGDYNGRVLVWCADAMNPEPLYHFEAHRGWVRAMAVSPDGRLLATCGNDNLAKLWSLDDFSLVRELVGHASHVYNVKFHPDGQHLVTGDLRGQLKQWNIASGAEVRTFDASVLYRHDTGFRADIGGIRGMAFNREGTLLACSGITNVTNAFAGVGNPAVVLFDWQTGRSTQVLRPQPAFQGTGWGVVFHPLGFVIAAGGGNGGALWFWNPTQANSIHTLTVPNNTRDLDLSHDGRYLAVPCFDNMVRIYDLAPPTPQVPANGPRGWWRYPSA